MPAVWVDGVVVVVCVVVMVDVVELVLPQAVVVFVATLVWEAVVGVVVVPLLLRLLLALLLPLLLPLLAVAVATDVVLAAARPAGRAPAHAAACDVVPPPVARAQAAACRPRRWHRVVQMGTVSTCREPHRSASSAIAVISKRRVVHRQPPRRPIAREVQAQVRMRMRVVPEQPHGHVCLDGVEQNNEIIRSGRDGEAEARVRGE